MPRTHASVAAALLAAPRPRVIPFLVGGWPTMESFEAALRGLDAAGAAVIEVGIPFSDPIADGPVIAQAMHEALERGASARHVLESVRRLRADCRARLVAMVSASIVERLGGDRPCAPFAAAGFDGIIVPDGDAAQSGALASSAATEGMAFVSLIAPTTEPQRAEALARSATGFVYALARRGITGSAGQAALDMAEVGRTVSRIRAGASVPVAVGFGISSAADVDAVNGIADAAIVGTPFIRAIAQVDGGPAGACRAAVACFRSLLNESPNQ